MKSILQIHDITREDFISIIDTVINDKLVAFQKKAQPENVTIKETAKLLGVAELTVHNYIKKGIIPASKIGRRIVIKRIDIENALNEVKSIKYKR